MLAHPDYQAAFRHVRCSQPDDGPGDAVPKGMSSYSALLILQNLPQ